MIRPRWMTNWESAAARLYAFLPCHNNICLVYLNYFIETSDANAAWFPYLPTIPNPIDASWIMPTSLPPSPMPALNYQHIYTMDPVNTFNFYVINAFWVGRHRQQITAGAFLAVSKNKLELLLFNMLVNAVPSTNSTSSALSYSNNFLRISYINLYLPTNHLLLFHIFIDSYS